MQLFTWHLPLCSKSWLYLWRTSYFLWPNYISLQSLLLLHSLARCVRPYLDLSTAFTIATSIVHSKLDYCRSLYYKLPKSESLNTFTSSCHLPTMFSQLPNLHTFITSSVQRPRSTHSSFIVNLARPQTLSSLKITDYSFRYASPCLWIQLLYLFVKLILVPVPPFPTHLFLHRSLLCLFIHQSAH